MSKLWVALGGASKKDTKFYFYRDKDIKIDIAIENVKI